MSYILDALRKSEHERQMATGQNISVSSPFELKHNNKPWLISSLLVFASLIGFALIWWICSQPLVAKVFETIYKRVTHDASQTQTMATETLPEYIVKEIDLTHENSQKFILPPPHTTTHIPPSEETSQNLPKHAETMPEKITDNRMAMKADPLKDIPALNISGYIHNEQGGSIAMINNQLIHEGEEVSPGLRLVKILDDSAIFSYKGYVFSR